MILKSGLSWDLEILEIFEHVNGEEYQDSPTQIKTLNTEKQELLTELKRKILKTEIPHPTSLNIC